MGLVARHDGVVIKGMEKPKHMYWVEGSRGGDTRFSVVRMVVDGRRGLLLLKGIHCAADLLMHTF